MAKLAEAMRVLQIHDPELFELERQVARTMARLRKGQGLSDQRSVSTLTEAEEQRLQMLRRREEEFLVFHTRQESQS